VQVTQWYGLAAPAGTPAPVLKLLADHLARALADPEVRQTIRKDAAVEKNLPLDDFRRYIEQDITRYREAATPALMKQIAP
jgi:tripartite-type tricarboxylate transporter receptor subunit TctC